MTRDGSGHLLAAFYAAARVGDAAALAPIVTDDFAVVWNGDPALIPWAGRHDGIAATARFFAVFQRHLEVVSVTPGDTVVAAEAIVTTVTGNWRLRATGQSFATRSCNIFRLRDGRISAYEVYNDTAPFVRALAAAGG